MRYLWTLIIFATSCAVLDSNEDSRSAYNSYISQHLQEKKIFVKLREVASVKLLLATPEFIQRQSRVVPGFELKPAVDETLFVVSIEMPDWARFNVVDYKFFWGEIPSKSVKEINDVHLVESLYPFSVPHDRVFIVTFTTPLVLGSTFKLQTSEGQFDFKLE